MGKEDLCRQRRSRDRKRARFDMWKRKVRGGMNPGGRLRWRSLGLGRLGVRSVLADPARATRSPEVSALGSESSLAKRFPGRPESGSPFPSGGDLPEGSASWGQHLVAVLFGGLAGGTVGGLRGVLISWVLGFL